MRHLSFKKLVVVSATLMLASCSSPSEVTDNGGSASRFDGKSELDVAYITYPPSMITDPNSGDLSGIMFEVAERVSEKLDLEFNVVEETDWASMVQVVEAGRVDMVVSGIWPSAARAKAADFSSAIYYSPVYAYARADDIRFDGNLEAANSSDVTIATLDGELSAIVAASDFPNASTESLPQGREVAQLMLQLSSRKADITFVEPAIAEAYIGKNPGEIKRVQNVSPVRVFPNTFLLKKGDSALLSAVNIAIEELANSGEIDRIIGSYDPDGSLFLRVSPPYSQAD